ncbi:MAG: LysR family transcriptional regulator [Solobacterium sp.]|nr:LysR family transcriptional regulator [Solobacterium sp.]
MHTKQIEYILELAETLNFNKAAKNLYISQPTMTYQIRSAEEELGFKIFERSGKGATLTPAGAQFIISLRSINNDLKTAIWQGQNFSAKYTENIRIAMPVRSTIHFLPKAIQEMMSVDSTITITPTFDLHNAKNSFLEHNQDILFSIEVEMQRIPDIKEHHLFDSHIYLVCRNDDPLAKKSLITVDDLRGQTLMVGGPSPAPLRQVQQRIINTINCDYFNSSDHDTSLTNVAAGRAVVLSPGFLNDHTGEFTWIPFDCTEVIPCALFTHTSDTRWSIQQFVELIKKSYPEDFPV